MTLVPIQRNTPDYQAGLLSALAFALAGLLRLQLVDVVSDEFVQVGVLARKQHDVVCGDGSPASVPAETLKISGRGLCATALAGCPRHHTEWRGTCLFVPRPFL